MTEETMKPVVKVVDDDESVRKAIRCLLASEGFECRRLFAGAGEFLTQDETFRPDCAVLDITMSKMSGIGLQNELISRRYRHPVIFLCGRGLQEVWRQLPHGAWGEAEERKVRDRPGALADPGERRREGKGHVRTTPSATESGQERSCRRTPLRPAFSRNVHDLRHGQAFSKHRGKCILCIGRGGPHSRRTIIEASK